LGWSGVGKIVPPSKAELMRIIGLLPSLRSRVEDILAELQALGGRYHRYLHQDEFGPTRAQRMQALRDALVILSELSSRFESLPHQLKSLFSEKLSEHQSTTEQLGLDLVELYSADKAVIDAVLENAPDVQQTLVGLGRTDDAKLIEEVYAAAGAAASLLGSLDTTTEAEVVLDAGSAGLPAKNNSADPFITAFAAIERLRSRLELALSHLARQKGPESRSSLVILVWQLCDLWRRETGRPVTANPFSKGSYTGRPQSASGRFVWKAVEALQPSAAWIGEREPVEAGRAAIITGAQGFRVQAVHSAMRQYIAADRTDSLAPRRGRPRQK
jgi:hypothetical protein